MEHQILNLLNETNNSKFLTRKLNIVNDQSESNYGAGNDIICNEILLKSNLCDYNNAYIVVRVDMTVRIAPTTQVAFKNCAAVAKCITKIDETTKGDAGNLDLVQIIVKFMTLF